MSISTKNGDKGDTSLFDGTRIRKNSATIDAIGISDELNAIIGLIQSKKYNEDFGKIQNELFVVGADIATPIGTTHESRTKRIQERHLEQIEILCKFLENEIGPITNFVIPGGSEISSLIHISRTISRKLERSVVKISQEREINKVLLQYLNRLSDYFYLAALKENKDSETKEQKVDFEI
jgi:cob(I)alamin adenosyltransferase